MPWISDVELVERKLYLDQHHDCQRQPRCARSDGRGSVAAAGVMACSLSCGSQCVQYPNRVLHALVDAATLCVRRQCHDPGSTSRAGVRSDSVPRHRRIDRGPSRHPTPPAPTMRAVLVAADSALPDGLDESLLQSAGFVAGAGSGPRRRPGFRPWCWSGSATGACRPRRARTSARRSPPRCRTPRRSRSTSAPSMPRRTLVRGLVEGVILRATRWDVLRAEPSRTQVVAITIRHDSGNATEDSGGRSATGPPRRARGLRVA